jgi:uncharacterized protein (TIGR02145 family)
MKYLLLSTILLNTFYSKCFAQKYGYLNDLRDKKIYKTVVIGDQIWMSENLNVSIFRNGDTIAEAKTISEWRKAGNENKPAWCYYDNDLENGKKYGKLYNWYAINDPRGLAPEGWHIPNYDEWLVIQNLLGFDEQGLSSKNDYFLGGNERANKRMKSTIGWYENSGTNKGGFSGLPGGSRNLSGDFNKDVLTDGYWWTSSDLGSNSDGAIFYTLYYMNFHSYQPDYIHSKGDGLSVRCIKD